MTDQSIRYNSSDFEFFRKFLFFVFFLREKKREKRPDAFDRDSYSVSRADACKISATDLGKSADGSINSSIVP